MREVSCRALGVLLKTAKRRRVDARRLLTGVGYDLPYLRDTKHHIDWDAFCTVLRNARDVWSLDELSDLNEEFMRSPFFAYVGVIARMLFTSRDLFDWICKHQVGGGAQLFGPCVQPSFEHVGADMTVIRLEIVEPYRGSTEFFWMTRGAFVAMPRLVGAGDAEVVMEATDRAATYRVRYRNKRTLGSALRWLALPFTARKAARELKAANEELQARYTELEKTRDEIEQRVRDRTRELSEARDELASTVVQLEQAQTARERFFANISHEIRTPLSLILLAAGDIEARANHALDDRSRRSLAGVSDGARKLLRLVDELLLLAAGKADKLRLHDEPTDLALLVASVVSAWRPAAEAAGLELATRAPATLVANVDPTAIERVISNLVSNAVKYTPRGGSIELELAAGDDGVRISVLDDGPGIDEELAGRLFGRFERSLGAARKAGGTGIGLALVKELVEAHGGAVSAQSRERGGTDMRVVLPATIVVDGPATTRRRAQLDLAPAEASALAPGAVLAPRGTSQGTILLAEDDAGLAEMVAKLLADEYTVIVALDGAHAADLIAKHQPHMLVTDVDMPGMSGIELSQRFRDLTNDKLAPIIIVSAVLDLGTRLAGLDAGAIDYITKPFDPLELRARVRAQFRMRDLAIRLHRAEQLSTLGILTSGLAHELRNPANGIINAVPPLRHLLPSTLTAPDSGVGQLLAVMDSCATQIGALSRQLLGFRDGSSQLDVRPDDLSALVDSALRLAAPALAGVELAKDIDFACQVPCAGPMIVQVLTNLFENAGHAVGRGGWISIRGRCSDGKATVEVTDSGPGVPSDLRERVFEPFFTTKSPGEGTGLGLSVARAIVQRHGGVLEIRDLRARPAFVMELPLRAAARRDMVH